MPPVRTLPEALATAAHGDAGYVFVGSGTETRRSYADMYAGVARAWRARCAPSVWAAAIWSRSSSATPNSS